MIPKKYTTVIDWTEIPIEHSSNPEIQQITFSQYKNTTTMKGLVAVSENGLVMYCSELYGGSITDRQIIEKCKLLEYLKPGDIVLADKGFDISDILEKKKVALNIPPFVKNNTLSAKDIMKTRAIANRRIIVENVIGRAKWNQILKDILQRPLWPIATQIFTNCFYLLNFKKQSVYE